MTTVGTHATCRDEVLKSVFFRGQSRQLLKASRSVVRAAIR